MGTRGPVPARSDQRRRRNKPDTPTEKVEVPGEVAIPEPVESWHPVARDWYRSLRDSGQARFYEPSDWHAAHFCASLMDQCLTGDTNAQLVSQVRGMMSDLLTTEGARRRAGIELERKVAEQPGKPKGEATVSRLADRRARVASDAS